MKLTDSQRRALEILRDNPGIRPREFGERMWPDSDCWQHRSKCGSRGVTVGGGMNLAAGGYLGKLYRLKLASCSVRHPRYSRDGWGLTQEGREALKEAQGR